MSSTNQKGDNDQASGKKNSKIILAGSLLGVIATGVGLIAVFFPDTFNLEKNRIAELSLQFTGPRDIEKVEEFLSANTSKIVKLDLSACAALLDRCPAIEFTDNSVTVANSMDEDECVAGPAGLGGTTLNLEGAWGKEWYKAEECLASDDLGVYRIKGYFLVPPSSGFGQGWTEWMLSALSEKDVLLKDY